MSDRDSALRLPGASFFPIMYACRLSRDQQPTRGSAPDRPS
jgi:hypothetical protein